jgi:hypothetical protein
VKTYHVEPFFPNVTAKQISKEGSAVVAKQMQQVINSFASQGWFYEGFESVPTLVNAGCLGFGAKTQELHHVLIFSRVS